ncbi:MAG: hypothetical protein SGJ01_12810 [Gemmatimonadota bacterium]|nr:hypothetical protein [Gemmatimonadota bacterium]
MNESLGRERVGFVLVELLVIVVVLSLLAGIALPKYTAIKQRAVAARAIGAVMVVRGAAYAANEATGGWPAGAASGRMPAGLRSYLPGGFQFVEADYSLAWRSSAFSLGGQQLSTQMVQVSTTDPFLCQSIGHLLGGTQNGDLLISCNGVRGVITLFVEQ